MKQYRRYAEPFSLILIDADHVKRINDRHGHCAGDVALRANADVCSSSVRDSDIVGRFGGEEFIILLPHTRTDEAAIVAERIRRTMLHRNCHWEGQALDITLSLGVAEASPLANTFDELIKAADQALYSAKDTGRNRTIFAEPAGRPDTHSLVAIKAA